MDFWKGTTSTQTTWNTLWKICSKTDWLIIVYSWPHRCLQSFVHLTCRGNFFKTFKVHSKFQSVMLFTKIIYYINISVWRQFCNNPTSHCTTLCLSCPSMMDATEKRALRCGWSREESMTQLSSSGQTPSSLLEVWGKKDWSAFTIALCTLCISASQQLANRLTHIFNHLRIFIFLLCASCQGMEQCFWLLARFVTWANPFSEWTQIQKGEECKVFFPQAVKQVWSEMSFLGWNDASWGPYGIFPC